MRVKRQHAEATLARLRGYYRDLMGQEAEAVRAAEIKALPSKDWRGVTVYRVMCHGDFGKGPHEMWLQPYILWSLIALNQYYCPFHR